MKIKTKLIINMVVSVTAVLAIVIASISGMSFIQGKLFYLTQKSTPYQMRTVEFQKELQGAITDLIKVNAAHDMKEYQLFRGEAEKSLEGVKQAQQVLEEMANSKLETYGELSSISKDLFDVASNRITSENTANEASARVSQQLKDSSLRLKDLDRRIRILQTGRANSFAGALKNTGEFSGTLRGIEELRNLVKDLQMVALEIQGAQKSTAVLIAKGKLNSIGSKISKNRYQEYNDRVAGDCTAIIAKIEEYAKLQGASLTLKTEDAREKAVTVGREVTEKLSALILGLEEEAASANEKLGAESGRQGQIFGQSNAANTILINNSELVSLGMSLEGLTNKLFTLQTEAEIDKVVAETNAVFSKINELVKNLNGSLSRLGAKDELKILNGVQGALATIRTQLFSDNGIVATLKGHLKTEAQAVKIGDKLRQIVIRQAEKGKETVSAARGDQERAIASVNKMVGTSNTLLIVIGALAVIVGTFFGVWAFRSVIRPLHQLIGMAEGVAAGDLHLTDIKQSNDEFGQVQGAMGRMVGSLRDMVGRITDTTATVASSSEELASTASELERNAHVQASGIEQTVTAMTEMVQTIQDVSGNAINTSDSAGRMKQIAIEGQKVLDGTSRELFSFAEIVKQSAEKTESLGVKSQAINDIVEMIKDIADQTNLLALNASIEAARAGEMGRGFAVVAESVRQLARRTIESSDEIGRTVGEMNSEVASSVQIMKKEREAINAIISHVDATLQAMGDIVSNVEQVFGMVQTIATATEEQSATAEDVNRTMTGINDVTRHLTVSVGEIKVTSDNFARLASELQQMVSWFRL